MEIKNKKPRINFEELGEEKKEFNMEKMMEEKFKKIDMPEMMKEDYKKMEMFTKKKWKK